MRLLYLLLPLVFVTIACTKPDFPNLNEKGDEQNPGVEQSPSSDLGNDRESESNNGAMKISITAGGKTVIATLVNNAATNKLREILTEAPLAYMSSENGFETYGDIGKILPTSNETITSASGDILLYASRYICILWGANTYSYTRLGYIEGISSNDLKDMFEGSLKIELKIAE